MHITDTQLRVASLLGRITLNCCGTEFICTAHLDKKGGDRLYLQISYKAPCTKGTQEDEWKGRKWYLSEHMLDDEIVKTAYAAFEAAVKHEILEGFKVDGKILFNPHTPYDELLKLSNIEVKRDGQTSEN